MAHIITLEAARYSLGESVHTGVHDMAIDPSEVMPIEPVETLAGDPVSASARALAVAGEYADTYAELRSAPGLMIVDGLFAGYLEDVHTHTTGNIPVMDAVHLGLVAMGDTWTDEDTMVLSVGDTPMSQLEEFVNAGLEEFRAALGSWGVVVHEVRVDARTQVQEAALA